MKQTPEMLAWAAGFLDGEGYIGTTACTHKGVARVQLQAVVDAAQMKVAPLQRLQDLFGGTIRTRPLPDGVAYYWRLYGAKAAEVLQVVRPYLAAKRVQADLVIEFQATKFANRHGNPNGMIAEAVYQHRLDLHAELRRLNATRGRRAERLSEGAPTTLVAVG